MIYYNDDEIRVTSSGIEVDGQVHRFEELTRIWHQRARRNWRVVAGRGGWSLAYLLAPAVAVLGVVLALTLDLSTGARVTIVVAAVLVGLAAAGPLLDVLLGRLEDSFDRGSHVHEIWAERAGVPVRLLQTPDAARFGRIYRAVQRAAET